MADNTLNVGVPRIGWYADGLPDDITPNTATMLHDDGRRITLTLPWLSRAITGQAERWFHGEGTHFGDDPDRTKFSYSLPETLGFTDVDGTVILVGCRSAGMRWTSNGVGHGVVNAQIAVLGGRTRRYESLHGMRTAIPGAASWTGLSSVAQQFETDAHGRARRVTLEIKAPEPIPLARRLNLRLLPNWKTHRARDGSHRVHDDVLLETLVATQRSWEEHFAAHNSFRDLLDIASWKPTGYATIYCHRTDDPQRTMSGDILGPRWPEARTYSVRQQTELPSNMSYLFDFEDAGATGYRRWLSTRTHFKRGIEPLLGLLDITSTHVESQLIQSSIGLEAIGYQTALDSGMSKSKAERENLASRLVRVRDSLPFETVNTGWPNRAAATYNAVKHADRALPDVLTMLNALRENILVFRLWASRRIGVSPDVLKNRLPMDPIARELARQGIIADT